MQSRFGHPDQTVYFPVDRTLHQASRSQSDCISDHILDVQTQPSCSCGYTRLELRFCQSLSFIAPKVRTLAFKLEGTGIFTLRHQISSRLIEIRGTRFLRYCPNDGWKSPAISKNDKINVPLSQVECLPFSQLFSSGQQMQSQTLLTSCEEKYKTKVRKNRSNIDERKLS